MTQTTRITAFVLTAAAIIIALLVMREALGGTTFRAADYDSHEDCIRNVPREWRPGSLEYTRAETACHYEFVQRRQSGGER